MTPRVVNGMNTSENMQKIVRKSAANTERVVSDVCKCLGVSTDKDNWFWVAGARSKSRNQRNGVV